jgi:hypothetical protein
MGSAVGQARGLPFVPPAAHGELFGAWMLRVAEAYCAPQIFRQANAGSSEYS